jgi:hypothetical protein
LDQLFFDDAGGLEFVKERPDEVLVSGEVFLAQGDGLASQAEARIQWLAFCLREWYRGPDDDSNP